MRILQLTQSFLPNLGGMEWVVHHLSNALVRRGHEVLVLTAGGAGGGRGRHGEPAGPGAPAGIEVLYRLEEYAFGGRFGELLGRNTRSIAGALHRLRRAFRFDLVHAHQLFYPGYATIVAQRRGPFPYLITDHGQLFCMLRGVLVPPTSAERRKILWTARRAAFFTTPGKGACEDWQRLAGPAASGRWIVNGVAVPSPEEVARLRGSVRRAADGEPYILMVGRHHHLKGFDVALRGFRALLDAGAGEGLCLRIVGSGLDELRPLAESLRIGDRLRLVPPTTGADLWRFYAGAALFWMPSRIENMPLVKYEALACGAAGVFSDGPGIRDDIVEGVNGLLFSSEDPEDLARTSAALLRDGALRERLSRGACETGGRYRWPEVVQRYEDFYRQVIERGASAPG